MSVEIIVSRHFQKEAKRLLKKYPSLKQELERLHAELEANPTSEMDSISDQDVKNLIKEVLSS